MKIRTVRAEYRNRKHRGEEGAIRLAQKLGCGKVAIYVWERPEGAHLPKNRLLKRAYLREIGLREI